jgi:uncharacterized membrane protein
MTTIPLHPALVHVPLGLAFIMPILAVALLMWRWRGGAGRRGFAVLLLLQALLVGGALVAMQTGERDEDRVERVVAERVIEAHEERAELFLWAAAAVLALAAAALVAPARALGPLAATAAAGTLAVAALAAWTGKAGGEIVYLHGGAAAYHAPAAATAGGPPLAREHEEHDDD